MSTLEGVIKQFQQICSNNDKFSLNLRTHQDRLKRALIKTNNSLNSPVPRSITQKTQALVVQTESSPQHAPTEKDWQRIVQQLEEERRANQKLKQELRIAAEDVQSMKQYISEQRSEIEMLVRTFVDKSVNPSEDRLSSKTCSSQDFHDRQQQVRTFVCQSTQTDSLSQPTERTQETTNQQKDSERKSLIMDLEKTRRGLKALQRQNMRFKRQIDEERRSSAAILASQFSGLCERNSIFKSNGFAALESALTEPNQTDPHPQQS